MVVKGEWVAVVAVLAGFCGFLIGRAAPGAEQAAETSSEPAVAAHLSAPTGDAGAAAADDDCVCGAERRQLVAALQQARRAAALAARSSWPADAGDHAPGVVESSLKAAVAECGEGVAVLEEVDCDEPPCVGIVRVGDDGWGDAVRLQNCPPWHDRYGDDVAVSMRSLHCDGERVNKVFMAPMWPDELLPEGVGREQHQERFGKRLEALRKAACE